MDELSFSSGERSSPGGRCPPDPLGFFALALLQQKGGRNGAGQPLEKLPGPSLLLFAAFSRRSGCVPAEPYPPLK